MGRIKEEAVEGATTRREDAKGRLEEEEEQEGGQGVVWSDKG